MLIEEMKGFYKFYCCCISCSKIFISSPCSCSYFLLSLTMLLSPFYLSFYSFFFLATFLGSCISYAEGFLLFEGVSAISLTQNVKQAKSADLKFIDNITDPEPYYLARILLNSFFLFRFKID